MKKILSILEIVEEGIASFFFITGSIIAIYGVFMRYIFNNPVGWTTEIFEIFMVAAIFLGFGMALKDERHIVVDLVYDKMPPFIKKIFNIISNVLGAGFSIYLMFMGIEMVDIARVQGGVTVDVGIPIWLTYMIMPIGMGLLSFYFLVRIVSVIRNPVKDEEQENIERMKNAV
ncbi:TRAP transporter small permease [Psychrobacillus lasiicapitis]|uniref:TRAP transporter small permease n=1 Tax=Psychrobacillus lasiicapitis TaxID=1636719 RepID=A0A544T336_9BACI|nr:TRAP transporter small permease [Psychrobacillus lasiicapitis]TQR11869.1 TRAP transporter small permease [Psychrobacillus lasiicapitis]GGA20110.1 C4-dicarboxylate TRAP transporter small permease protein DctQ [Psychrobacillus lasiicapitis]